MSSNDTDDDSETNSIPGHPVFPDAGQEEYYGKPHPYAVLAEGEFANQAASVAGLNDAQAQAPDEIVQLGQFKPAYLRQWAELLEFAYGHYSASGFPRGTVHLELRKNGEAWCLMGKPEFGVEGDVYPIVGNMMYPESRTALPQEADSE